MKFGFEVKLVEQGRRGSLYTVQVLGQEKSELERFFYDVDVQSAPEYGDLMARLDDMVDNFGFREQFFKMKEGASRDSVVALHYMNGGLRLYCLRWSSVLLIAGYGGVKTTQTYQQDPVLHRAVSMLQAVDAKVDDRLKSGELSCRR